MRRVGLVFKTPARRSGGNGFNSQPEHVISLSKKFTHTCFTSQIHLTDIVRVNKLKLKLCSVRRDYWTVRHSSPSRNGSTLTTEAVTDCCALVCVDIMHFINEHLNRRLYIVYLIVAHSMLMVLCSFVVLYA